MDFSGRERNRLFVSTGNSFEDVSFLAGLDSALDSRSFVYPDLDHDGAPDIVLINRNAPILRVYRNELSTGNWIGLNLKGDGKRSNSDAVGAMVRVRCGENTITRHVDRGTGYAVQNPAALTVGLGACSNADSVSVRWPDGTEETFENLKTREYYVIRQGARAQVVENYYAPRPAKIADN